MKFTVLRGGLLPFTCFWGLAIVPAPIYANPTPVNADINSNTLHPHPHLTLKGYAPNDGRSVTSTQSLHLWIDLGYKRYQLFRERNVVILNGNQLRNSIVNSAIVNATSVTGDAGNVSIPRNISAPGVIPLNSSASSGAGGSINLSTSGVIDSSSIRSQSSCRQIDPELGCLSILPEADFSTASPCLEPELSAVCQEMKAALGKQPALSGPVEENSTWTRLYANSVEPAPASVISPTTGALNTILGEGISPTVIGEVVLRSRDVIANPPGAERPSASAIIQPIPPLTAVPSPSQPSPSQPPSPAPGVRPEPPTTSLSNATPPPVVTPPAPIVTPPVVVTPPAPVRPEPPVATLPPAAAPSLPPVATSPASTPLVTTPTPVVTTPPVTTPVRPEIAFPPLVPSLQNALSTSEPYKEDLGSAKPPISWSGGSVLARFPLSISVTIDCPFCRQLEPEQPIVAWWKPTSEEIMQDLAKPIEKVISNVSESVQPPVSKPWKIYLPKPEPFPFSEAGFNPFHRN